jgi:hypothetical protein
MDMQEIENIGKISSYFSQDENCQSAKNTDSQFSTTGDIDKK